MAETSEARKQLLDAFRDRLSQRARDTSRPALAHQSLGRPLSEYELTLADAMMTIMSSRAPDFAAVAEALRERGIRAPVSGRTDWDLAVLQQELAALNTDLDKAYEENGYGA